MSIVDQLAQLNVKPEQIKYVGISHYHARPHRPGRLVSAGDAADRQGRLGRAHQPEAAAGVNPAPFAHWITGGGKVEPLPLDKDVFGDGTVIMLATPGHTPGHHSLLVKLKQMGTVLITGDLAHFRENYESNGVPTLQHQPRRDLGLARPLQEDRGEPEGDGDHPARRARHR